MDDTQFFKAAKGITLAPRERVMMKEAILEHAERSSSWWLVRFKGFSSVMASMLVLVMVGSGISYAAENTVPGDVLYPIKIYVNEEVAMRMMQTENDRARWEAHRAERRLREARVLTARGGENANKIAAIEQAFERHATNVEERLTTLKNEQRPDELRELYVTFHTAMKAQVQGLTNEEGADTVRPLLRRVHMARVTMKEVELESMGEQEEGAVAATTSMMALPLPEPGAMDEAPAAGTMMMKVAPPLFDAIDTDAAAEPVAETVPTDADENEDDLLIEAEARMNIAKRKMKDIEVEMAPPAYPVEEDEKPIREKMKETNALLQRGAKAMDEGKIPEANEAASEALVRVRVMKEQMKIRQLPPQVPVEVQENIEPELNVKGSVDGRVRLK